jgi:uncharacterized protein (TIGR03435 family)
MKPAILGTIFFACVAFGQPADAPPKFEAADIHSSAKTQFPFMRAGLVRAGRYEIKSATMVDLIHIAYNFDADKIVGGPNWLEMDRFDVTAKVPAGTTPKDLPRMLQSLLADRFKLVVHKETKPLPAYALVAGKKPQLKEAAGTEDSGCKPGAQPGAPGEGGMTIRMGVAVAEAGGMPTTLALGPGGTILYNCRNTTMAAFVAGLPRMMGTSLGTTPVIDDTGLKGAWNFDVRWSMGIIGPAMGNQTDRITVFDALDKQLGLKLEERKVPTPVIVVEKVNEKPSENPPGTAAALPAIPAPREFEVASIKPADPNVRNSRSQIQPGGRVNIVGMPMHFLLSQAFNVTNSEQLAGLPGWVDSERFDITAKAPSDGPSAPALDRESAAPMMRSLLEERFKMTYHTEDRQVTAYSLVAAKPKMKKADPASRTFCKDGNAPAGSPPGSRLLTCQNITMAQFADRLQGMAQELNWPVSDATGIGGGWDFTLLTSRSIMAMPLMARVGGEMPPGVTTGASEPNGSITVFEALEKQLGLKLEKGKRSEPVIVIDHLEQKPTEN